LQFDILLHYSKAIVFSDVHRCLLASALNVHKLYMLYEVGSSSKNTSLLLGDQMHYLNEFREFVSPSEITSLLGTWEVGGNLLYIAALQL